MTNHHKLSILKQHVFIVLHFRISLVRISLKVSGQNRGVGRASLLSGFFRGEGAFLLIWGVGSIQHLVAGGPRSLFPWLSAGSGSQLLEAPGTLRLTAPSFYLQIERRRVESASWSGSPLPPRARLHLSYLLFCLSRPRLRAHGISPGPLR